MTYSRESNPIRVAQIMGKMDGGGVESVIMNYYRHIDRATVQFDFLVDDDSKLVPKSEIESLGGRIIEIKPYQDLFRYQQSLRKALMEGDYAIAHSHINALSVFSLRAAKAAGVPVRIAHSHSTSDKSEHAKDAAKRLLRRFANVYPTHRFACSRYAGEWLFGDNVEFEVMHNAIELAKYAFSKELRKAVRADLGIADEQVVIGHVGRFMRQKNHAFLIEAFAQACGFRKDLFLICIGAGDLKADIERKVSSLGVRDRVLFLGQRNDVNQLYQAFDAFALPSLYEGLGLVAIEAQMSGLPCFLSDGITREVDVTGTVGFLPIHDAGIWARTFTELTPKHGRGTRPSDFEDYDIDVAAKVLSARYRELRHDASRLSEISLQAAVNPTINDPFNSMESIRR